MAYEASDDEACLHAEVDSAEGAQSVSGQLGAVSSACPWDLKSLEDASVQASLEQAGRSRRKTGNVTLSDIMTPSVAPSMGEGIQEWWLREETELGSAVVAAFDADVGNMIRPVIAQYLAPWDVMALVVRYQRYCEQKEQEKTVVTACRRVLGDRYLHAGRVTSAFFVHLDEEFGGQLPEDVATLARAYVMTATEFSLS